jgi:predicted amidohydrolase YtcJ
MSTVKAFKNGRIFTATGDEELAELMVVEGGLVKYIGTESEYEGEKDILASAHDLGGSVVLPGFIDSHTHLEMMGHFLGRVNLINCNTLEELRNTMVAFQKANPEAKRLLGRSWLFDIFGKDGEPTRHMLDDLFPDVPVYLDANDLHSCWLNGAALKEIGVDDSIKNPQGGEFARDKEGHLTGFLLETALTE